MNLYIIFNFRNNYVLFCDDAEIAPCDCGNYFEFNLYS